VVSLLPSKGANETNYQEKIMKRILLGAVPALLVTNAFAHGDHDPDGGRKKPPPLAVLQLDQVRDATARFLDVEKATSSTRTAYSRHSTRA
jgi:hypothetical protein